MFARLYFRFLRQTFLRIFDKKEIYKGIFIGNFSKFAMLKTQWRFRRESIGSILIEGQQVNGHHRRITPLHGTTGLDTLQQTTKNQ